MKSLRYKRLKYNSKLYATIRYLKLTSVLVMHGLRSRLAIRFSFSFFFFAKKTIARESSTNCETCVGNSNVRTYFSCDSDEISSWLFCELSVAGLTIGIK